MKDDLSQDTKDALEMMDHSSVPIQGKIAGFTPLMDVIAEADGIVCAAVFGKVWRYCQMKDEVCKASTDTIASGLGIDRSTVSRHLATLCEKGYIKDLSPDVRNAPHVYADAGKIRVRVSLTVAENTPTVAQRTPTVAESRMSKDSKKDSKKETLAAKPIAAKHPELTTFEQSFSELTGIPLPVATAEKKATATLWWLPTRRMVAMANGQAIEILAEAVKRMRADRLTIANPNSVEKVFTSIYGEKRIAAQSPQVITVYE